VVEGYRLVLGRRSRRVVGLLGYGARCSGIDHLLEAPDILEAVEQFQRSQGVVLVIGQWVRYGRLVAVVAGEMEGVIEVCR